MAETVVFSEPYVWEFLGQIGIVFVAMLAGNVLRTFIPRFVSCTYPRPSSAASSCWR